MTEQTPWLLIDVGNTAIKWRLANAEVLLDAGNSVSDVSSLCEAVEADRGQNHILLTGRAATRPWAPAALAARPTGRTRKQRARGRGGMRYLSGARVEICKSDGFTALQYLSFGS